VAAPDSLLTGLTVWYSMDEVSGVRVDNNGDSSLDLADLNTVGSEAGKVGLAGSFISANAEQLRGTYGTTAYSIVSGLNYTMAFWAKVADVTQNETACGRWLSGSNIEYWIYAPLGSPLSAPVVYWGSGAGYVNAESPDAMTNDTWHLVIVEIDRAADTLGISLDNGSPGTVSFGGGAINESKNIWFYIGGASASPAYDGGIDEFAIWHRLLTSSEKARLAVGMGYPG
ncbi:uncharacterized protein METZ01_LOCUS264510, partial [marine metagenome]